MTENLTFEFLIAGEPAFTCTRLYVVREVGTILHHLFGLVSDPEIVYM